MKTLPEYIRSLSLVLLAASIAYFGYALITTAGTLGQMTSQATRTVERLDPLLALAPTVLEQAEKLRQTTDATVSEVAAVRELLPSVLDEVRATRETVPAILTQTERMRVESQAIRKEIALTRDQIPPLLAELEAYRTLIPQILAESERIRQLVPPTLDRVESIVTQADEVASTAGENVFTGMISGIVKAPFKLIGSAASAIAPSGVNVSEADTEILEQRIETFLGTAEVGDIEAYVSRDGTLTWRYGLTAKTTEDSETCRELDLTTLRSRKQIKSTQLTICLNQAEGEWYLKDAN
ncbi:hypothetical protein RE428_11140 [Marinobacter nanhaiticus D15-8W]|uniref:Surface antigen domain-containing protein n=1 Tax=Marinobacter nanhaiticus D15-8W TaxID=626887 RepID=N6VY19_9GAMM|nr:hypothetical protein [Marinobacter nanhaiticus]ENO12749.1 hypothetical protein J057_15165 [Marinobacter nanhaiticus D15-8W]BES70096.1 hypothetical protein RE428_11140 [Marinobacter nanhaiticus D15-8W]